jgi:DNA-binding NtrC family response regulator
MERSSVVRVLLVEDDEEDYFLTRAGLSNAEGVAFNLDWIKTYDTALEAIKCNRYDVYLIDYWLGARDGLELLREAVALDCKAPLILLTAVGDHEVDAEAMQAGAADYLVKGQISGSLLVRSIRHTLERSRILDERDRLIRELQDALAKVKMLSGLLPICSSCKKIRDDQGDWTQLETYVQHRSGATFSHGVCPECLGKLYGDLFSETGEAPPGR